MVTRTVIFLALMVSAPAWPQAVDAGGTTASDTKSAEMLMPPPISAVGLPTMVGAEERENFLTGGVVVNAGYINNLYPASGTTTVNDELYLVSPTISADRTTDRVHESFTYAPAFAFYQHNSVLNTVNQSGAAAFQYRLSPQMTLLAGDTVAKTSDTWSQPLSSGAVSGGLPSVTPGVVAPFAPQVSNSAYAQLGWQLSLNDMVGGGGNTTVLNYSGSSKETAGLYNSNLRGGSGFYTHRLTDKQYIGATYQYSEIVATPAIANGTAQADLNANTALGFYTVYLNSALSLSLGGGAQHYKLTQASTPSVEGNAPSAFGSLGWQGLHTSFVLSCSRIVTEGTGIIGVYSASSAEISGRWQVSPNWVVSANGTYSDLSTATRSFPGSTPGGHSLSGTASVARRLGENLGFGVQYQRLHQSYPGVAAISSDPDSSRVSASISYHFSRPLGR